ncbi:MAG TPA: TonB-dependent receptor [Sphingobacteriaceae bacterium]
MQIKLIMVFMIAGLLQVNASGYAQKISISQRNVPLQKVFKEIKAQSGYTFVYTSQTLQQSAPVNVNVSDVTLEEALNACFKGQLLTYTIQHKTIIVQKKELSDIENQAVQQATIRGKVTDEKGLPMPGVTVRLKSSNRGVSTNQQGEYSIVLESSTGILVFSFIGYTEQQVPIAGKTVIDIVLQPSLKGLDEVVVVGYGTQKRSELIGSVSQISAKDVNDRTTPQLQQALTGQLAGVTVIQRSGQPGAPGGGIQIRGVGSFGAGTAPLVLIDGIPGSMNDIDPNDVENISVLKDASSAAIYGSRAANGVILITTKIGKSENATISYNAHVGVEKPTAFPDFVSSWEYASLRNEVTGSAGGYTAEEIQKFKDGSDPYNYPNINYLDEIIKRNSIQTAHNVSVSQKSKSSQYLVSMGYLFQDGVIAKNSYNRYNLRLNLISDIRSNLKLTTRISGVQTIDSQPNSPAGVSVGERGTLGIIGQAIRLAPIYPAKLENGDFGVGVTQRGTPVSLLASDGYYKNKITDLNGNFKLDWEAIPGLKFSVIGGYTQSNGRDDTFYATQRLNANLFLGPSTLNINNYFNNYKTLQQLAEYDRSLGKHTFGILAGHSYEAFYNEETSSGRIDFPSNDITVIDAGSSDDQTSGGSAAESALDSYFGRVKYGYANKYLAEGSIRYDGSSRFPANKRYALYPSAAVGWRISEENFLKQKFNFLNELKLRASYGILGNQNIGNYPYQEVFSTNFNYGFGNTVNTGVANTTLIDPTIHWESTRTYDIGLDAGLWNGKLAFGATYYNRYTYDLLVSPNASVSNVLGFGIGRTNSGALENRGWEFTVDHRHRLGRVNYFLSGNFSIVNNEVLDLGVANITQPNGMIGNGSNLFLGYPMQPYYGYLTDGLYVDDADVASYTAINNQSALNPAPKPGNVKYRDISGPNGVPDGKVDATYDRTVLGSTIPKYTFGLNLGTEFKGFSLSALIQGVSGVQGQITNHAGHAFFTSDGNVQRWQMEERWTPENPNPNAKYPRLELVPNNGTPSTLLSDYWMLDASYIKLRNIQLGYLVPSASAKRLGLNNLRFNASAENLLTISGYRPGWDPEQNPGFINYYPILANFTFGLTANF